MFLGENDFLNMLRLERKRTERSGRPFCLMLLNLEGIHSVSERRQAALMTKRSIKPLTREVDIKGWYNFDSVMGVIFIETDKPRSELISEKVRQGLNAFLDKTVSGNLKISMHVFPEGEQRRDTENASNLILYPDLLRQDPYQAARLFKRVIDVVGSTVGLIALSPILLIISFLIKTTSEGPVFFRQERMGLHGRKFVFLKFRTMQNGNDPGIHKKFVEDFIHCRGGCLETDGEGQKIFKIKRDPRVTRFGRLLRKTSLDELPQLYNVLKGEMSLVGPRPPIPYEYDTYNIWHKRRVLEIKPGITGLWQVWGRSSTNFDEMVRLDIHYLKEWSIWLDIKILMRTPLAMLLARGAY